jgi:RHS repeat-associated protein
LISASQGTTQIAYKYDGDGNRVQKILAVNGQTPVTTRYLVDTNNLTGYAQVLEELDGNNVVQKRYTYGLDLISQTDVATSITHYYGYDGTGSVRFLTDSTGAVSDTYDYEAFGQTLSSTGSTNNEFKFHGERQDPETSLIYLRARYLDGNIGRFTVMDSYEGNDEKPLSLHKYLFADGNPVNNIDPTGNITFPTEARRLKDRYGWRIHPITKKWSFHGAVDIGQRDTSWRVYSILDGQVTRIGRTRNGTNYILIRTGHFVHGYYHTKTINKNTGSSVQEGEWIGVTDLSGNSTGPHLHFRIHMADDSSQTIDPWPMIRNAPLPGENRTIFQRILGKVRGVLSSL